VWPVVKDAKAEKLAHRLRAKEQQYNGLILVYRQSEKSRDYISQT
jgi:hypothetical protein